MDTYTFSTSIKNKDTSIIGIMDDSFKWTVIKNPDNCAWIYTLLRIDDIPNEVDIIQLELDNNISDDEISELVDNKKISLISDNELNEIHPEKIHAQTKLAIYNHQSKFQGIDEFGELVPEENDYTSTVYDVKMFMDDINLEQATEAFSISGYIIIVLEDGNDDDIIEHVGLFDIETQSVNFFYNINKFLKEIKNKNYLFLDHIVIETTPETIQEDTETYVNMIITEL